MSQEISIDQLINDVHVRKIEDEGKSYFCLIDIFSVLLKADRRQAQNYYHVFKKRMLTDHISLPLIRQFKARAYDKKFYLTDFTTIEGIEFFYTQSKININRKNFRIEERKSDEVFNFHPKVVAFLQQKGWQTQHHVKLLSGSIIDIVAFSYEKQYVVECKPELNKSKLYAAIGQVLCYSQEYDAQAIPIIATYASEIDEYAVAHCKALEIIIIAI
jgi:hypothetical protein